MQNAIRIIGIDPGLRRCGWGVIETLGNSLRFVASDNRYEVSGVGAAKLARYGAAFAFLVRQWLTQEQNELLQRRSGRIFGNSSQA